MKKCTKCGKLKASSDFYRDIRANDALYARCKQCHGKIKTRDTKRRALLCENPTPKIAADFAWWAIQQRLPQYVGIECRMTREELTNFYRENWTKFLSLHELWKASGFRKRSYPSLDRIDPKKHYELGNLQLIPNHINAGKDKVGKPLTALHKRRISRAQIERLRRKK